MTNDQIINQIFKHKLTKSERRIADKVIEFMGKWQPIETAPKDGTDVLLYEPSNLGSEIYSGHYGGFLGRGGYWGCLTCEGRCDMHPTHWKPLPNPPQSEEETLEILCGFGKDVNRKHE